MSPETSPYSVFDAGAQTIVNTVNTRGVMGTGLALEFRLRYPDMFEDYEARCERGEVEPGHPYLYRRDDPPWVLNFPTKDDWRKPSQMAWIEEGLERIPDLCRETEGLESIAFPPLGTRHGGLDPAQVVERMETLLADAPVPVYICRDERLHPEGAEAQMLEMLASTDLAELSSDLGLRSDIAEAILEAVPLDRFRHLANVDGVGDTTYESVFRHYWSRYRAQADGSRQATLF